MSAGLPKRFDPQRLVAQNVPLQGELDTGRMSRLSEMLASGAGTALVQVGLRAFRDDARRLLLKGRVNVVLQLVCQRCLEPVELPVTSEFTLAIVADEAAARGLPATLDPLLLPEDTETDLAALVEDELILALPPVPMHADPVECGEQARYGRETHTFDGNAKKDNPFAVLKKLKNGNTD